MRVIPASELIINDDGSIFHLHVKPEQISTTIIMCGDPNRVTMIASHFDSIECEISSREFHTITGNYKGKRISVVSHGIGPDNIEIVLNELDALVNIDFATRTEKPEHTELTIVRIGTSGGLQEISPVGTFVVSKYSMGFDGVLNFYDVPEGLLEMGMENAFRKHSNWSDRLAAPYCVKADEELVERIGYDMVKGITIAAPGFYAPQGRYVRAKLAFPDLNSKVMSFEYNGDVITNFEMESSMVAGLGKLLGHKAMTVCAIIAGRVAKNMNTNYKNSIEDLVKIVLERI